MTILIIEKNQLFSKLYKATRNFSAFYFCSFSSKDPALPRTDVTSIQANLFFHEEDDNFPFERYRAKHHEDEEDEVESVDSYHEHSVGDVI